MKVFNEIFRIINNSLLLLFFINFPHGNDFPSVKKQFRLYYVNLIIEGRFMKSLCDAKHYEIG